MRDLALAQKAQDVQRKLKHRILADVMAMSPKTLLRVTRALTRVERIYKHASEETVAPWASDLMIRKDAVEYVTLRPLSLSDFTYTPMVVEEEKPTEYHRGPLTVKVTSTVSINPALLKEAKRLSKDVRHDGTLLSRIEGRLDRRFRFGNVLPPWDGVTSVIVDSEMVQTQRLRSDASRALAMDKQVTFYEVFIHSQDGQEKLQKALQQVVDDVNRTTQSWAERTREDFRTANMGWFLNDPKAYGGVEKMLSTVGRQDDLKLVHRLRAELADAERALCKSLNEAALLDWEDWTHKSEESVPTVIVVEVRATLRKRVEEESGEGWHGEDRFGGRHKSF